MLVTAGPTEEPIDEVRFIGNRSSGRMGVALAHAFADAGASVRLALGPIRVAPPMRDGIAILPFRTSRDLETLLRSELPAADLVVMAAAVADFRPRRTSRGKLRRTGDHANDRANDHLTVHGDDQPSLTLELDTVPDLLATTRSLRKVGSRTFGFALEPAEQLRTSALAKLERKDLAGIVANPLETMDAADIDGTLFLRDGRELRPDGRLAKDAFARWLAPILLSTLR
ncbi:MAG: phosphopantothenoylcysteine decarboxylase [Planctomycetaceae bacterium]|nr:phosphopantothenoylcysteine decarboxylase [Planctomycetaceae bacterium]